MQLRPSVIYIPTCYYWGITVRHQLGMDSTRGACWETVVPHEVAHLWWGHALGWDSYRDQWMSEGFSNLSASLYLQAAYAEGAAALPRFLEGHAAAHHGKERAGSVRSRWDR